jgi:6-pyruvoyltetrahydropterin/6-carboxytetrahydropterin synthase
MALIYESTKTFTHAQGLSCCFRQWRAKDSHCRFLHGYALQIKLTFAAKSLDERNWVVDFGAFKGLKSWLEHTFDHKLLVAKDDPELNLFRSLAYTHGVVQLVLVEDIGCEAFAKMISDFVYSWLEINHYYPRVWIQSVEVSEHAGNSATVRNAYSVTDVDAYHAE